MNETPTRSNGCTINICAFKKQYRAYLLAETDWRPTAICRIKLLSRELVFFCTSTSFLVMTKTKILKSSNCLIKSHCATGQFFANLPLRKPFLVQNYNLGFLNFRQTWFFAHFLAVKNYKNIKETAQMFFNQARTEYCIAKIIKLN